MEAHIEQATNNGRRTWFGTLTLTPSAQEEFVRIAREKWMLSDLSGGSSDIPEWWDDPFCDYRFSLVRDELVAELQKYWKRLRKAGHRFKYIVVFERHKSGHPHMHCLLHEVGDPITKRELQAQWPHGFTQMKIVADGRKAAYYVSKYLSKSKQARQIASTHYDTQKHPLNG